MQTPDGRDLTGGSSQAEDTVQSEVMLQQATVKPTPEKHVRPQTIREQNELIPKDLFRITTIISDLRKQVNSGAIEPSRLDPVDTDNHELAAQVAEHVLDFKEIPVNGFDRVEDYMKYDFQLNRILARERASYNQNPAEYHFEDPEIEGKKMSKVTFTCADGRICPANFLDQDHLTARYATRWLPHAGLIMFPEVKNGQTVEELEQQLKANPELEKQMLDRMDTTLSNKVKNFLIKKANSDQFSRLHFELQSHFEKANPNHGCGAHKSNFNDAQAETIKDAMLIEYWLKRRYPEQFEKGWFRIYRTVHDTGAGGNIYSGSALDQTEVKPEFYAEHQRMFEEAAERYSAPKIAGLEEGVFQKYQQNVVEIKEDKHDEQAIRVSDTHFAHTILGQSVLEIAWTDSADNLFGHLQVLLGIIEKNFRKNGQNLKPAVIHFDLMDNRPDLLNVYRQVQAKIDADPDLQKRLQEGSLKIVMSETDPHTYLTSYEGHRGQEKKIQQ